MVTCPVLTVTWTIDGFSRFLDSRCMHLERQIAQKRLMDVFSVILQLIQLFLYFCHASIVAVRKSVSWNRTVVMDNCLFQKSQSPTSAMRQKWILQILTGIRSSYRFVYREHLFMSNIRQILFTVEVTRANTMYLLQVAIKCISIVRFLLEYSNCWKAIALSIPIGLSLFVQGIYANMYAVALKKPFGCSAVYCMCNRQSVTSVLTD